MVLISMQWLDSEELLCVLKDGRMYTFSLFGEKLALSNILPSSESTSLKRHRVNDIE